MNDEKEIIKDQDLDSFLMAEMIEEASPYLIIIPKTKDTILKSGSS